MFSYASNSRLTAFCSKFRQLELNRQPSHRCTVASANPLDHHCIVPRACVENSPNRGFSSLGKGLHRHHCIHAYRAVVQAPPFRTPRVIDLPLFCGLSPGQAPNVSLARHSVAFLSHRRWRDADRSFCRPTPPFVRLLCDRPSPLTLERPTATVLLPRTSVAIRPSIKRPTAILLRLPAERRTILHAASNNGVHRIHRTTNAATSCGVPAIPPPKIDG